jgi:apolipoprotein N-acyltransferase
MENSMIKTKMNHSYVYLLIGIVFLFFFNGRWIIPISAFLAPLFLIRFLRFHKPFKGFLLLILVGWVSNIFIWKGMMPLEGFFYYVLMIMMSLFTSITYLMDRIYSQKVKGIISSLVFPSAYVIMEYIVVSTNPSGSYGTLAHTQSSLPLLQIVAITGIWGVTFLIMWTASIINWLWDNSFERRNILLVLLVYGIPFLSVIFYGQFRLSTNIESNTVRVASINISKTSLNKRFDALDKIYGKKDWSEYDTVSEQSNNDFLNQCHIAASSGAKIVFGIETVISLAKGKEIGFIEKAKVLAQNDSVYLGLPIQLLPQGFPEVRPEDKIIWISPEAQVLFTYHKAKPTPGEGTYGDGLLKYFDSPYGRISTSICFDMDFPGLISQVNNKNVDIMLVPGSDWPEITPYHTYVSSFRAIEHGFNIVRSATKGLSASFNYKGQLLSSMNFYKTNELILYSDIPTKGQKTIYSILGDYFAWLCILFFVLISGIIIKRNLTRRSPQISRGK